MRSILLLLVIVYVQSAYVPKKLDRLLEHLDSISPYEFDQMEYQAYKKALLETQKTVKANEGSARLKQIMNNNNATTNKTQLMQDEIKKIEQMIFKVSNESLEVNKTIVKMQQEILKVQQSGKAEMKEKLEEVKKEREMIKQLESKRQELRSKIISLIHLRYEADEAVNELLHNKRQQRAFARSVYENQLNREQTRKALENIKEQEFNKTIKIIHKANNFTQNLRQQDRNQEMVERAQQLEQDKIAEEMRRRMLIIQEQIRTAKFEMNQEQLIALTKQMLEFKRYEKARINCAKNQLRKYKLYKFNKLNKDKEEVFNQKLADDLENEKNTQMDKIKAEIHNDIDNLKNEKNKFDAETRIKKTEIDHQMNLQDEKYVASLDAQDRKYFAYKDNLEAMNKARRELARAKIEQKENEASMKVIEDYMKNIEAMNKIDDEATKDIKRKELMTSVQIAMMNVAKNYLNETNTQANAEVEALRNKALQRKQERQDKQVEMIKNEMLEENQRMMKNLKNKKQAIHKAAEQIIKDKQRKQALKESAKKVKLDLASYQGSLDREVLLRAKKVRAENVKALKEAILKINPKMKSSLMPRLRLYKPACAWKK